ncbi:hypothetical protein [Andreprevotia chitinilytica]|uniref:hypothetical protein n=1 Tax=Andreprevotia chitinilytica TaxID=396808 RepID=UPI0005516EC2|nr:hypothetical protein [Andreprevotia chitinilytica]
MQNARIFRAFLRPLARQTLPIHFDQSGYASMQGVSRIEMYLNNSNIVIHHDWDAIPKNRQSDVNNEVIPAS